MREHGRRRNHQLLVIAACRSRQRCTGASGTSRAAVLQVSIFSPRSEPEHRDQGEADVMCRNRRALVFGNLVSRADVGANENASDPVSALCATALSEMVCA